MGLCGKLVKCPVLSVPLNIGATTDAEWRTLEADYQLAAFASLPHAGWRSTISSMLQGSAPVFCNVSKS